MAELVTSPWLPQFERLLDTAEQSLILAAPYMGYSICQLVRDRLSTRAATVSLWVLTDLSPDNLLSGATDITAVALLAAPPLSAEVIFLPRLHAKVYVADEARAIITSGNLTASGLMRNHEYGVEITRQKMVRRVRRDIKGYGQLGNAVTAEHLELLNTAVQDLRATRRLADRSISHRLRVQLAERMDSLSQASLRARVGDRSLAAILAETILFILHRDGPLSIDSIHEGVRNIHPDLCDDTVDRVIDGRHYGKKWKHAVRTAQQHLKRKGMIALTAGLWHLTAPEGLGGLQDRE
jgi:hypothetical protein